jgi:hypothetical protein
MLYPFTLLAKRLALPALAILLGASLYMEQSRVMVANEMCRTFVGDLSGNDPSARAELELCNHGGQYEGTLKVRGESGYSEAHLEGHVVCDGSLRLIDQGPLTAEPADGWAFCFDDVFHLRWDGRGQRLAGGFVSEECNDAGTVNLRPLR